MDKQDPKSLLESMATGSFSKVVASNDKTIYIEAKTEKVKNSVLRQFVTEAGKDGFSYEDLVDVLLEMDQAVEENTVKKTLSKYLG